MASTCTVLPMHGEDNVVWLGRDPVAVFFKKMSIGDKWRCPHAERERERESVRLKLDVVWWGGRQDD